MDNPQDWVFDRFDDEMLGHLKAMIDHQDAVLLGRNTYEAWAQYWPTSTHEPFASFINSTPKFVASTTLTEVIWPNATLLDGDVASEVAQLKAAPGNDIGVHGSVRLVRYLLRHNLVDELKLAVFPVVTGTAAGDRLFDGIDYPLPMRLVDLHGPATASWCSPTGPTCRDRRSIILAAALVILA